MSHATLLPALPTAPPGRRLHEEFLDEEVRLQFEDFRLGIIEALAVLAVGGSGLGTAQQGKHWDGVPVPVPTWSR